MNDDAAGARPEGDAALVRRMAGGDRHALGALWDRHGATAFSLACSITASPSIAEAVVADAFAHAWRGAPTFDPQHMSVFAWLTSLVRSHALAAKPRDVEVPRVVTREALDGMQARAIELAFFGGMTKREIASALQLPEGAVASLLRGAVEALGRTSMPATGRDAASAAPLRTTP